MAEQKWRVEARDAEGGGEARGMSKVEGKNRSWEEGP